MADVYAGFAHTLNISEEEITHWYGKNPGRGGWTVVVVVNLYHIYHRQPVCIIECSPSLG